jgi:hypothetical protein
VPVVGVVAFPLLFYLNDLPSQVVIGALCVTSALGAPVVVGLLLGRRAQLRIDSEGISFARPVGRTTTVRWEQLLDARVMERETRSGRWYTLVLDYRRVLGRAAASDRVATANVLLNGPRCRPEEVLARVAAGFQTHLGRPLRAPRFSHLYERLG